MLKLHDLTVGQRFTFSDKHRGKVFRVIDRQTHVISYEDTATGEVRDAWSNRKTFRMEVELVTENRVVELTLDQISLLETILHQAYLEVSEKGGSEHLKSTINNIYLKLTGSAGRRVVLPEGE